MLAMRCRFREVRDLIRRMSLEIALWDATKIHAELLKLAIEVAQSTVSSADLICARHNWQAGVNGFAPKSEVSRSAHRTRSARSPVAQGCFDIVSARGFRPVQ